MEPWRRLGGFLIRRRRTEPACTGILIANSVGQIDGQRDRRRRDRRPNQRRRRAPELTANAMRDCALAGVIDRGPLAPWLFHNTFQRIKPAIAARDGAKPDSSAMSSRGPAIELPADVP